jgi:hypothetical protein
MLKIFRQLLTLLSLQLMLWVIAGCHLDPKEISPLYNRYKFDTNVIEKLPVYDSLAAAILEKSSFFQQHINEKDSYRSYRYLPFSHKQDMAKKLPADIAPKIDRYFARLGKNFIYGFDVFKDSTIKIYIRRSRSDSFDVEILENLSYFPSGNHIPKREFPVKDTILNKHWQYWIEFYRSRVSFFTDN